MPQNQPPKDPLSALPMGLSTHTTFKPPLHGSKWMADHRKTGRSHRRCDDLSARRQRRGRRLCDDRRHLHAVGSVELGRRDTGLDLQPAHRHGDGINALGVAPTGATAEFFKAQGLAYPPGVGPLAAVTPGTPGGIMVMLAEYGRLSLAQVLEPAIELADGYPMEAQRADSIEAHKATLKEWPDSRRVLLPHRGESREAPEPGEIFRQPELAATLRKLVEARGAGAGRRQEPRRGHPRRIRALLSRRHRRGVRAAASRRRAG